MNELQKKSLDDHNLNHNAELLKKFYNWYFPVVGDACIEVALGCSDNVKYSNMIKILEESFKKRVKAVVLVSKEYTVFIYPKIHASDDVEAVDFSDIYVKHDFFEYKDYEEKIYKTEEYTLYNVRTDASIFALAMSVKDNEEPYKEWRIDFSCLYYGGVTEFSK